MVSFVESLLILKGGNRKNVYFYYDLITRGEQGYNWKEEIGKLMMTFDDDSWCCGSALIYIFFADSDKVRFDLDYRKIVRTQLLSALDEPMEGIPKGLLQEERSQIKRLVDSVRKISSPITEKTCLAPIVWVKLAMQLSLTGTPIAQSFLQRYSRWRKKHQHQNKLALVVNHEIPDVPRPNLKKNDNLNAYALDVFILTDMDAQNLLTTTWIVEYISIKTSGGVQNKPKKSTKDVVGANVYLGVKRCITKAAEDRLIPNELRRKSNGRYVFKGGTRLDLLKLLRKKFPGELKYSDKVIIQAISEFAACGRYKSRKQASVN